ncbi:MAG TPA: hypothetical protein VK084_03875 [Chitinophagaceae bacterium]|nr:hypothetical protein [Chitinophagaceae bacterium]
MRKLVFLAIFIATVVVSVFYYFSSSDNNATLSKFPATDTSHHPFAIQKDSLKDLSHKTKDTIQGKLPKKKKSPKDSIASTDINLKDSTATKKKTPLWPVDKPPLLSQSLLPSHRIIAFYGNLYSTRMGILGEYPADTVLARLQRRVHQWQKADSTKQVLPALELITMSAQATPGSDSLYNMRMPFWMVDSVIDMARSINAITILDFQVGKSTVEKEVPYYEKYLKMPDVHLAVDPEFYMKRGNVPGTRIGTMDAKDVNYCINYLKKLVKKYDLPPKILVIHRFTQGMITNYQDIKLSSEVQVIIDMDGFGAQYLKRDSYKRYIYNEPIEYTGIKLFLKNDNANGNKMFTPDQVLNLHPEPIYVQYQ